jgi:hypothetical protein
MEGSSCDHKKNRDVIHAAISSHGHISKGTHDVRIQVWKADVYSRREPALAASLSAASLSAAYFICGEAHIHSNTLHVYIKACMYAYTLAFMHTYL